MKERDLDKINGILEGWHARLRQKTDAVEIAVAAERARQAVIDEAEARRAAPRFVQPVHGIDTLPDWELVKPKRWVGYSAPLYKFLEHALDDRQPIPKAAHIMKAWKAEPPSGYGIRVSENLRELTYYAGGDVPEKTVPSKAVQRAINRMTGKTPRTK